MNLKNKKLLFILLKRYVVAVFINGMAFFLSLVVPGMSLKVYFTHEIVLNSNKWKSEINNVKYIRYSVSFPIIILLLNRKICT